MSGLRWRLDVCHVKGSAVNGPEAKPSVGLDVKMTRRMAFDGRSEDAAIGVKGEVGGRKRDPPIRPR